MKRYVVGFAFNPDMTEVVLIKKNKPEAQKGIWNGVGGKIEIDESELEAMVREFREETGVVTDPISWRQFVKLEFPDAEVTFFCRTELVTKTYSMTDEIVTIIAVADLVNYRIVPNLHWLIPMAIYDTFEGSITVVHKLDNIYG